MLPQVLEARITFCGEQVSGGFFDDRLAIRCLLTLAAYQNPGLAVPNSGNSLR